MKSIHSILLNENVQAKDKGMALQADKSKLVLRYNFTIELDKAFHFVNL